MTPLLAELRHCAAALGAPAGPSALYRVVGTSLQHLVGHRLFTLLVTVADGTEVERIWSSDETAYPVTGRKRMGPTPWGDLVLKGGKPWYGNGAPAIRWAFPDHDLIASLGLGSCINVPIIAFGRTLGTINLLDREGAYAPDDVETVALFAPFLVAPCLGRAGAA